MKAGPITRPTSYTVQTTRSDFVLGKLSGCRGASVRRRYRSGSRTDETPTAATLDDLDALSAHSSPALSDAFPTGLLGDRTSLYAVVVPESADHFAGGHFAHVHSYQSDDEHTVAAQVVLGELGEDAGLALGRVERSQLLAQVLDVTGPVQRAEEPSQRVDGGDECQEDVPEPDEDEELLVEEVDGQRTLDDVLVHARLVPHLELAQRHARKTFRVRPVLAADQPPSNTSRRSESPVFRSRRRQFVADFVAADQLFHDVDAVEMVVDLQERVEEEQLADGVGEVHELDGHVPGNEIVAVQLAADDATHLGDEVFYAHHAASAILSLSQQVSVHLIHDVTNRLQTTTRFNYRSVMALSLLVTVMKSSTSAIARYHESKLPNHCN